MIVSPTRRPNSHPRAPRADVHEALIAYTVFIGRPVSLIRTCLLLASKGGQPLAWLAQPGTNVWLIPHELAIREGPEKRLAPAGTCTTDAPAREVLEPSLAIEAALTYIGRTEN